MEKRELLISTLAAVTAHLCRAPLFSLEKLQEYVLCVLNAALMDSTNIENLFWHEERVIEVGAIMPYTPTDFAKVDTAMKDLVTWLVLDDCEVSLETGIKNAGYLYGPGEIWVTGRLKFKKESRIHARDHKVAPGVLGGNGEATEAVPSEPGLLEKGEPNPTQPEETQEACGGPAGVEGADPGPGSSAL